MDLNLFKLDIDELINEYAEGESTTLAEFKRVWLSRKFSFIFEASPSTDHGLFMQSLYAHSIGYMVSDGSLSNRLGGLYCLYCLYETQPFKPPYRIYLSLGELRRLIILVVDAKTNGVKVVPALLKGMLDKNMFLFGSVGVNEGAATVNELTDIQNAKIRTAYEKLFANSRLEHFINLDMGMELDVDMLKKCSSDYAAAKELAIKEASLVIDVEDIKHIAESKRLLGDMVEKTAADWDSQKQSFYEQTGYGPPPVAVHQHQTPHHQSFDESQKQNEPCDDENYAEQDDQDNFDKELEEALLIEQMECDNEDAEPSDEGDA